MIPKEIRGQRAEQGGAARDGSYVKRVGANLNPTLPHWMQAKPYKCDGSFEFKRPAWGRVLNQNKLNPGPGL